MRAARPGGGKVRAAVILLALVPSLLAPEVVGRAMTLGASGGDAYYAGGQATMVFLVLPLVTLSAFALFILPGVLLASAMGKTSTASEGLFYGFVLSLLVVSLVSGLAQAVLGPALRGRVYAGVLIGLSVSIGMILRRRRGPAWLSLPPDGRVAAREAMLFALFSLALYYLLAPKLLWESFNGDGAHAFESSRLLLRHALPFWSSDAGPVAGFPGMTSMLFAFPNAWFLRLLGETEYAVRVPFLLYMPVLAAGIAVVASVGRRDASPRLSVLTAVLASLACYAVAMAFSATYNPYSADVALPATQDTLLMIVYLVVIAAAVMEHRGWLALGIALTYVSLPNGLILIGFWIVARLLAERPRRWREAGLVAALVAGTVLVAALVPALLSALGAPPPGREYGIAGTLRYFAFLQFTDLKRLIYIALPAGVVPIFMACAWRNQDWIARALSLVTGAYFLFFFVQAHISVHHFVPAMILPIAVAARMAASMPRAQRVVIAWLGAAALSFVLVFPPRLTRHETGRLVGATIAERLGDYASSDPAVFRGSTLLEHVFPFDWDPAVPGRSYGGSPLVWNRYAVHGQDPTPQTNYLLLTSTETPPDGWRLMADSAGAALYLRSDSLWMRHRHERPTTPAGSRWLTVPRSILFRTIPHDGSPRIIDVAATLEAMGLDVDMILARLGVSRER